jgi:hypothetical protein
MVNNNTVNNMNLKLGIDLSPKQRNILKWCEIGNGIQYVVVSTGRQVGKSTIALVTSISWCAKYEGFSVGIYLPVYKQARNLFKRLEKALRSLSDDGLVTLNKSEFTVTFNNGSSITFLSADNENMRSFTFDAIIVDEANFIKEDIWYGGIQPTVAASLSKKNDEGDVGYNGKVLLTSTPKSKNWFYGFVQDEDDRTIVTRFTSEEGGILAKEFLAKVKKMIPESIYRNEYMGEFLDSGNGLFKYLDCINNVDSKQGHIAGLDVASKEDYMSLTIQNIQGNVIFQDRWRGQSYSILLKTVANKLREYGSPICYVETNGVGQVPFEILRDDYGKVKPWVTTNNSKNEIIQKLIVDFNTKSTTILDIDYVKDELDNFSCEWKNGKATYGGVNGFHDDTVMSLAICNYNRGKVTKVTPKSFTSNIKR